MTDPRHTDHPVAPGFPERWSPRSFTDRKVSAAEMMSLLEAARWAPSASNHQPWRFVWALRGEAEFAAIHAALVPGNQSWAGRAGALIVVASKDSVAGSDGTVAPNRWAAFDTGAAWISIALQARTLGLATHAMGGFGVTDLAQVTGLPEGHTLHAVVTVGQRGLAEELPDPLRGREKPSPRQPVAAFARRGRF